MAELGAGGVMDASVSGPQRGVTFTRHRQCQLLAVLPPAQAGCVPAHRDTEGARGSPGRWPRLCWAREEEASGSPCLRDRQGAPPLFSYMKPERNSNTCFPRCSYLRTREGPAETPPDVALSSRLARHRIPVSSSGRATPRARSPWPGTAAPALGSASQLKL